MHFTEHFLLRDICLISLHRSADDVGWDSVGGIATGYRLDGQGTEPWWGPTQPSIQWVQGLFTGGGVKRLGRVLTTNTHIGVRLKKE
jgi:hypothetical protein